MSALCASLLGTIRQLNGFGTLKKKRIEMRMIVPRHERVTAYIVVPETSSKLGRISFPVFGSTSGRTSYSDKTFATVSQIISSAKNRPGQMLDVGPY